MRNVKAYLTASLRWLGVVADFVASAASGAPIGITTGLTAARGRTTALDQPHHLEVEDSSGEGHEGSSAKGLDP
jgi:hypothetical protein